MEWLVKTIGYELSKLLLDKLQEAIIYLYQERLIKNAEDNLNELQKERAAIIRAISAAKDKDDRRSLVLTYARLSKYND